MRPEGIPWCAGLSAGSAAWVASEAVSFVAARLDGTSWARRHRVLTRLVDRSGRRWPPGHPARLPVGVALRAGVALMWSVVMARWLDREKPVLHGAGVGAGLWAMQFVVIGRRTPEVRELNAVSQLAEHVVFGTVAGACLGRTGR